MAAPTGVYVMKSSSIMVDDVEYNNQTTRSILVPDSPIQTKRTLVPDGIVQDVDSAAWVWQVAALQKNDAGGLALALRSATPGEIVEVVFMPLAGLSKPQATFSIIMLPVQFGGDQGAWADFEATFPVIGSPVFGTSAAS